MSELERKRRIWRLGLRAAAVIVCVWFALAYLLLPLAWTHYERQPGLAQLPMRTKTADGIPGDPINVGFVGARETVIRAFGKAGWSPADAITLRSSIEIAASVALDRPDLSAPVSPLFYDGRKQDLAFEKQQGASADRRHHIRLWKTLEAGAEGLPVWLASATFDRGVGLSHDTGQITHHIAPDVDAERDFVIAQLTQAGAVTDVYEVSGSGANAHRPQRRRRSLLHRRRGEDRGARAEPRSLARSGQNRAVARLCVAQASAAQFPSPARALGGVSTRQGAAARCVVAFEKSAISRAAPVTSSTKSPLLARSTAYT